MYKHIMVPLDGSELAECVLAHAETIATGCNVTKVTLVRVVTPLRLHGGLESRFNPEERKHLDEDTINVAREYLDKLVRKLKENGVAAESEVLYGEQVVDELVDYTEKNEVDLIIIATHGRSGVSRLFLGSVADRVLRAAPVPVLMVRAPGSNLSGV